jgi:transposase-like protein
MKYSKKNPKCPYCNFSFTDLDEIELCGGDEYLTSCPECEEPLTITCVINYTIKPTKDV